MKILVVEDDERLLNSVRSFLIQRGYEITACLSADDAYTELEKGGVAIIVTDIMMPDIDGFKFVESVRNLDKEIPIVMMTARDDFTAKERGFALGIDDFMTKPVNLDELNLRLQAIARRANIKTNKKLEVGNITLDEDEHSVYAGDEEIKVTVREFNILHKMLSYPKKTFTRTQLMDEFWKSENAPTSRTVDVYMTRMREKFSEVKDFEIVTVHGLGYKAVIK